MDQIMLQQTYTIDWAIAEATHPKTKFQCFWGHRARKDGTMTQSCFSQWFPAPFEVDGAKYITAEHWMMAEKARLFGDSAIAQKIIAADTPGKAKSLGRQIKSFDAAKWDAAKFGIVVTGNLHKFRTHQQMADVLLKTGNKILVEASPVDPIWGIGLAASDPDAQRPERWKGENLLGFALMQVRDMLQEAHA
jgi:ribA/ribD-fused uncharacterized protein